MDPEIWKGAPPHDAPPGPADCVVERLLSTAGSLFYREGIHAVGIQRLIDEAGIAKASLYAHFDSKDDLVAAYLARRSTVMRAQVADAFAREGDPRARLAALWELGAEWAGCQDFRGCPFQNAAAELASDAHPARAVIADHTAWLRGVLDRLAADAGAAEPARLGGALLALLNGAAARALAEQRRDPIDDTRWAAEQLLTAAADASAPPIARPNAPPPL